MASQLWLPECGTAGAELLTCREAITGLVFTNRTYDWQDAVIRPAPLCGTILANPVATMSPGARIAVIRKRRNRTDKVDAMFKMWLQQEREQHQEFIRLFERDIDDNCLFRSNMLEEMRHVRTILSSSVTVLRDMADGMKTIDRKLEKIAEDYVASTAAREVILESGPCPSYVLSSPQRFQGGNAVSGDDIPSCSTQQTGKASRPCKNHNHGLIRKGARLRKTPRFYSPEN